MKRLLIIVLLAQATAAYANDGRNPQFLAFSVQPVAAFQSKGNTFSAFLNYTPRYHINDQLYARLNWGFSLFRNKTESTFLVMDTEILGGYFFTPNWGAELGGGIQTFFGSNGGTSLALSGNLVYRLSNKLIFIDRFTAGYTVVLLSNATTHEIRLGVGASF